MNHRYKKNMLFSISSYLRPYIFPFFILIIISILWSLDVSFRPYLVKVMVDTLEKTPKESQDLLYRLREPVFIYIFLAFFMNIMNRLFEYISLKVFPKINKDITISLTKYIQKHSHSYFQNHFGGSLVSKISIAADSAGDILDSFIHHIFSPGITLCVAIITITMVYPPLAMIVILWAFLFIGLSYYLSRYVHFLAQELSEKQTTLVGKLIDSINNILAVRLFARAKYEIKTLKESAGEKVSKEEELRWTNLRRQAVMETMANLLVGVLLLGLIAGRQQGIISIGDFALILGLSISIIDIIWNISRNYIRFVENMGRYSQAISIIMSPHEIEDSPRAYPLNIKEGIIEFKDVSFSYNKIRPLFQHLSLKIKSNEKVGLVGYSGSGKTTFANLIVRLFDVTSGSIFIDGQDIKKVTQESLHENISFIPQEPMLFHRTILENIRYGNLNSSKEEIIDAAQKAHAHEFIKELPNGYDTLVGERGAKLSGGQRQRLSIARAILKNSKILILDEATSALDTLTERNIQESLELLMQNKTVLIIAHRLSTLHKMDRLLIFENGRIVEEGKHASLIRKKGVYAKLWRIQIHSQRPESQVT